MIVVSTARGCMQRDALMARSTRSVEIAVSRRPICECARSPRIIAAAGNGWVIWYVYMCFVGVHARVEVFVMSTSMGGMGGVVQPIQAGMHRVQGTNGFNGSTCNKLSRVSRKYYDPLKPCNAR